MTTRPHPTPPPTFELFHSIDSFCAANPDDPLAAGWIPPQDRPPPAGSDLLMIDFDAPPATNRGGSPRPEAQTASERHGRPTPLGENDAVPRLMDTTQAAAYLGTTERFIRRCVADGRLVVTKVGRYNRYTAADLDILTRRGTALSLRATKPSPRPSSGPATTATYDPIALAVARGRVSPPLGKQEDRRRNRRSQ